jgi:signal transduction histidine kinase/ligand-binding sensor domain-containing protein
LLIVAILSLNTAALALDRGWDVTQYAHTTWTLRDGALKGSPSSFAQTADGYLWIGTEFGVFRFDGVRLVAWQPQDETGTSGASVLTLLATSDGSLWIGTTRGLLRWKDEKVTRYSSVADEYVSALIEAPDGTVWLGTSTGFDNRARLCAVREDRVRCQGGGTFGRYILSLFRDADGTLLIGAHTGLWRWGSADVTRVPLAADAREIRAMADDGSGRVLVALRRGIVELADGVVRSYAIDRRFAPLKPTALLRDRDGCLWIGTLDQGLLHVRDGRVDRYHRSDGLSDDFVRALFEDREGNIWVATLNGFDRFRDFPVVTVSTSQGLSTTHVTSVLADRDGSVWFGSTNALERWTDGRIARHGNSGVGSLFQDRAGRLWVSGADGVSMFHAGMRVAIPNMRGAHVHAITQTADGDLWLADQDEGLYRLRNDTIVQRVPWTMFGGHRARVLAPDPLRGGLWLGFFEGGVAYFDNGRIEESYTTSEGLGQERVSGLHPSGDGTLWVATGGGLHRLNRGRVHTLTKRNGLPCNQIQWMVEDERQSLWLRTACGLVRLHRSELEAWVQKPDRVLKITVYAEADGLPSRLDHESYGPKVTRSRDGRLWFATFGGVGVIDPNRIPANTLAPHVKIEMVTAGDITHHTRLPFRVPPRGRDLRIDYTALSFTDPGRVRFRYMLEGRDQAWIDAGTRRQAFYSDLPPGRFRFRVAAANHNGVWNHDGAVWEFTVTPAWYETEGFRVAVVTLIVGIAWLIYRIRMSRLAAAMDARFRERLAERTRIARDLHDTLLQGFVSMSMQLHVLGNEMTDASARARLDRVLRRINGVIEEGRQTVQGLRSGLAVDSLDQVLARDAEELRGEQQVDVHVVVEGRSQRLAPPVVDDVHRICREALANAFGHAAARRVEIAVQYTSDLRIAIRDDGRGIDAKVLEAGRPGHWGIRGMRERADAIGARLGLRSGARKGTEVILIVPGHVAFESRSGVANPFRDRTGERVQQRQGNS